MRQAERRQSKSSALALPSLSFLFIGFYHVMCCMFTSFPRKPIWFWHFPVISVTTGITCYLGLGPLRRLFSSMERALGFWGCPEMILSHMAPSCLNMSSYRAIWTHFRPNFIFFGLKNIRLPNIQTFPKMQISSSSHSHKYLTYMGR